MSYVVTFANSFEADLDEHLSYLHRESLSPAEVDRWFARISRVCLGLDTMPHRCPIDPYFSRRHGAVCRKINVGDYLIFYRVDEAAREVRVLAFMHGAKRGGPATEGLQR